MSEIEWACSSDSILPIECAAITRVVENHEKTSIDRRLSPARSSIPRTFETLCATRGGPTGALELKESKSGRSARASARLRDDSADILREPGEVHDGSSNGRRSIDRCPRRPIVDREHARERSMSSAARSTSHSTSAFSVRTRHSALALGTCTRHLHSATVPRAGFDFAYIRRAVRHSSWHEQSARGQRVELRPLESSTRQTVR